MPLWSIGKAHCFTIGGLVDRVEDGGEKVFTLVKGAPVLLAFTILHSACKNFIIFPVKNPTLPTAPNFRRPKPVPLNIPSTQHSLLEF